MIVTRGNMITMSEAGDFVVLPYGVKQIAVKVFHGEAVLQYGGRMDEKPRPYMTLDSSMETIRFPDVYGLPNYFSVSSISADETCYIQMLIERVSNSVNMHWGDTCGMCVLGKEES